MEAASIVCTVTIQSCVAALNPKWKQPRMCRPHLSVISSWNLTQPESYCVQVCQCWQVNVSSLYVPAPPPTLTSDLLGEFDALGVSQWFGLLVNVLDIQHLTHELYHRLSTVESCRWHCREEHARHPSENLFIKSNAEKRMIVKYPIINPSDQLLHSPSYFSLRTCMNPEKFNPTVLCVVFRF